jgi:hypothetical protein
MRAAIFHQGKFVVDTIPDPVVTSMPLTIAGTTVMSIGYNPQLPGAFAEYLPLAERMAPLITGRVGLDGVQAAFSELANPEAHAKILVEPAR